VEAVHLLVVQQAQVAQAAEELAELQEELVERQLQIQAEVEAVRVQVVP
jgi:hypothetical protein